MLRNGRAGCRSRSSILPTKDIYMIDNGASAQAYCRAPLLPRLPSWERIKARIGGKLVRWGLDLQPEGNLVSYAKAELNLAGWTKPDSMYEGMIADAVVDMQKLFSMEGHSGMSAGIAASLFERLSRFQPLTPLTGEDDEWNDVGNDLFQNRRCSHVFKENGQAYDINGRVFREPSGACYTGKDSRVAVTFPYVPSTEYMDAPGKTGGDGT